MTTPGGSSRRNGGAALKLPGSGPVTHLPVVEVMPQWRGSFKAARMGSPECYLARTGRCRNGGAALKLPGLNGPGEAAAEDGSPQWRGSFKAARIACMGDMAGEGIEPQWRGSFKAARIPPRPARASGNGCRNGGAALKLPGFLRSIALDQRAAAAMEGQL